MTLWSLKKLEFWQKLEYSHPCDTAMLLKDTIKQQEFKIVLLNKFQVLDELLEEAINEKWQAISHSH